MDEIPDEDLEKRREEALKAFHERYDDERGSSCCTAVVGVPIFLSLLFSLGRSWIDILIYGGSLSVAIFIFTYVTNVFGPILPGKRRWKEDFVDALFHDTWFALLMGSGYYLLGAAFVDVCSYLINLPGSILKVLVTGTSTLVLGVLFFWFRLKARIYYGITEIIVGVSVACYRVSTTTENEYSTPYIYLILLTAGVYLIVRGLDNVKQGIDARRSLTERTRRSNETTIELEK